MQMHYNYFICCMIMMHIKDRVHVIVTCKISKEVRSTKHVYNVRVIELYIDIVKSSIVSVFK